MNRPALHYLIPALLTGLLVAGYILFRPPPGMAAAVLLGLSLTALNGLAMHLLHAHALRCEPGRFLAWSLGASLLRAGGLLGVVAILYVTGAVPFRPLLVTVLTGYFALLFVEIVHLHHHANEDGRAT